MILNLLNADPGPTASELIENATEAVSEVLGEAATAGAQAVSRSSGGIGLWGMVAYIIGLILLFYFFAIRPNKKREQERQAMKAGIQLGDWVITTGGLYGKVVNIYADEFMVEFGTNKSITIPIRKDDILGAKKPELTNKPEQEVADEPKKKKKFGIF